MTCKPTVRPRISWDRRRVTDASCLISDVQMPGIGGLELQRILRVGRQPDLPIIFITAFPDAKVRQVALQNGALCFLSKPFDGNHLIECLETAVGTGSLS